MPEYRIKWNKHEKIYVYSDVISVFPAPVTSSLIYHMLLPRKITNYQNPPEEKELALDEIPRPDFEEILNPDTGEQT